MSEKIEKTFAFVSKDTNNNSGVNNKSNSSLSVDTKATSNISKIISRQALLSKDS